MITDLHLKYEKVVFSAEVASMFAEIIDKDVSSKKVLVYISKKAKEQLALNGSGSGVTINEIVENVEVDRSIRQAARGKSFTYKTVNTNIQRKTAERIVDKLLDMSLIYYRPVKPYKFLFPTRRGLQVLGEISKRTKGDEA